MGIHGMLIIDEQVRCILIFFTNILSPVKVFIAVGARPHFTLFTRNVETKFVGKKDKR